MLALASFAAGADLPESMIAMPLAASVVPPVLILVLCAVAGIGTMLLLPSRKDAPLRKIGAAVMLAAGLILAALLVRAAAGAGGMGVYFWVFSAVAIVGAVRVVTHPRPVYSALYFVLTVLATAGMFVLLWAEFMAAALVLIYAGAILVTYVFVIMLAAEAAPSQAASGQATTPALAGMAEHDAISRDPLIASAAGYLVMGVLLFVIFERMEGLRRAPKQPIDVTASAITAAATIPADTTIVTATPAREPFVLKGGVQQLGSYLFEKHLVNLELAGLILTVAMVGAIIIARRRVVGPETLAERNIAAARAHAAETVTGPATPSDDNPHSIPVYGTENPRQKAYPET